MLKAFEPPILMDQGKKLVSYKTIPTEKVRLKPWAGRYPAQCKFKPGDIVRFRGMLHEKVGVVLALPLTPEEAMRLRCDKTDDVYLIGLLGKNSESQGHEHAHVPEKKLLRTPKISLKIQKALEEKRAHYLSSLPNP
jgi:hypothetical protein